MFYQVKLVCLFVDQRNVSSATEMVKLTDLCYKSNKDGNVKVDAKRNFNSRGNHYVKTRIFRCAVSGNKKPEIATDKAASPTSSQIRECYCKILNHRRSECTRLNSKPNNCARVGLKGERIETINLSFRYMQMISWWTVIEILVQTSHWPIVELLGLIIISQMKVSKFQAFKVVLAKFVGTNLSKISPVWRKRKC